MFSLDLTSFLNQDTSFYAGFLFGLIAGGLIAYYFFKKSLRYADSHIKHLKSELERMQKHQEFLNKEFSNALTLFLTQSDGKNNQS